MKIQEKIQEELDRHTKSAEDLVSKLVEKIESLPDNPEIQRVEDGKGFVISSNQLRDNWLPEYYDFRAQYSVIISKIKGKTLQQVNNFVESLLKTGKITTTHTTGSYWGSSCWTKPHVQNFRPEVLEYLRKIYYED